MRLNDRDKDGDKLLVEDAFEATSGALLADASGDRDADGVCENDGMCESDIDAETVAVTEYVLLTSM